MGWVRRRRSWCHLASRRRFGATRYGLQSCLGWNLLANPLANRGISGDRRGPLPYTLRGQLLLARGRRGFESLAFLASRGCADLTCRWARDTRPTSSWAPERPLFRNPMAAIRSRLHPVWVACSHSGHRNNLLAVPGVLLSGALEHQTARCKSLSPFFRRMGSSWGFFYSLCAALRLVTGCSEHGAARGLLGPLPADNSRPDTKTVQAAGG